MKNENYYFDANLNSTVAKYDGFLKLEDFQTISNGAQIVRKAKGGTSLVVILEDMKVLTPDIQAWVSGVFMPNRVAEGTLKSMIFIVPRSAIANMSVKKVNKGIDQEDSPIKTHYVGSMAAAKALVKTNNIING